MNNKVTFVIILAMVIIATHLLIVVDHNLNARANPPVSCQVFGGKWNLWYGWRCGG